MKLNVIVFKNCKIQAFTTPNFVDLDPEVAAKQLERSIIINQEKEDVIAPYKNLDMYHIGTFDDETGVFENIPPVLLLSPREICMMIDQKKLAEAKKEEEVAKL